MSGDFSVQVQAHFEAAHFLRSYRGGPEPLHGHSYKVIAELSAASGSLDHEAIAVDFVSATRELEKLARRLDYKCINDVEPFDQVNPTAENIAEWFSRELAAVFMPEGIVVRSITIWEGPFNSIRYLPR